MNAKIFISGNSQAVRLPKEVAFPVEISEVIVEKTATGGLLLMPLKPFSWDSFFDDAESTPMDISLPDDEIPDPVRQQKITQRLDTDVK